VAFGPFVGFMAGALLWLLGTFALSAVATVFADSAGALVPALRAPGARAALLVTLLAVLAAVNVAGVRQGTRVNTVATVAKLLPLLLLAVVGIAAVDGANLRLPATPAPGQIAGASVVLIFAFAGIESALVPSGEVRDTARTVPRAIAIAMVGVTLLYLALHVVAQGTLGPRLAQSATPLADAAGVALGPWGSRLMLVGAVISTFGYVSGMTLAVPRALYAFGRDGFLPRAVAAIHPRYHTPWIAIIVQSVLVSALAVSGSFERLAILANVSTLLLYGACCVAAWELRRRDVQAGGTPLRVPGAGIVPWVALAVIAFILSDVKAQEWLVVAGVLAAAAVVFAVSRGRRPAVVAE
jgi:APA family basic amino acid/polyamine antiporter